MENAMKVMSEKEMIAALLLQMQKQNQEHTQEMKQLLNESVEFINAAGLQISELTAQLKQTQQQLTELQKSVSRPLKVNLQQKMTELQAGMKESGQMLNEIKATVKDSLGKGLENIKNEGKSKLNSLFKMAGLEDKLSGLKDKLYGISNKLQELQEKIATVGREYREAGNHIKNIGRAIGGKELKVQPEKEGTAVTDRLQKLCEGMKKIAGKGIEKIEGAINRLRNLDRLVEQNEKNPSVIEKLEKFKDAAGKQPKESPEKSKTRDTAACL